MKALIVGFGRMGQRYERALKKIAPDNLDLFTVDLSPNTQRISQHYLNLEEVPNDIKFDIAIDARPNQNRFSVLKYFFERSISKIIVEKPHASSISESLEMMSLAEKYKGKSKVMLPFYMRYLESFSMNSFKQLGAGKFLAMHVNAGALGFGCNGIHLIDLSTQLFERLPSSIYGQLEIDQIGSPRGPQYRDHGGLMVANFGDRIFTMNLHSNSSIGTNTTYVFEHGKIQVNEQYDSHWTWWKRSDEHFNLAVTRSHLEQKIEPIAPFDFNLEKSMIRGIQALLNNEQIPTLLDGHNALKIIALSEVSTVQNKLIKWGDDLEISNIHFKFT